MILHVFESILHDKDKMAYYEKDPIRKAVFLALYNFKKMGYKFSDLGWFHERIEQPNKN